MISSPPSLSLPALSPLLYTLTDVQIAPEELALIYNLRKMVKNDWVSAYA